MTAKFHDEDIPQGSDGNASRSPYRPSEAMRVAIFTGSFNPFTIGHASIVERGLRIFDRVVVAIGINADKPAEDYEAIRRNIGHLYRDEQRVKVITFSGLAVDAARSEGACAFLKGVRSVTDFEYERTMADVNRRLSGIDTVLLYALPELASVSSSIVRELASYGVDTSALVP